jgi:SAM-dependent methyltransferase
MDKIKSKVISAIYDYIYIPIYFSIVYFRDLKKIINVFGQFEKLKKSDSDRYTLIFNNSSRNVCGRFYGEIIKILVDLKLNPENILLDGDNKSVVAQFKERLNFNKSTVSTVGLGGDFDYLWNFEDDCPKELTNNFDLIISQAMIEHLINPFKHLEDLSKLLKNDGYLIVHSVMPGYTYHRYPIDTVRFFPDWFEFSAKKLGLKVERKFLKDFHLFYLFKK